MIEIRSLAPAVKLDVLGGVPWNDRAGKFSFVRLFGWALVLGPAIWLIWRFETSGLGPRPVEEAIHFTGDWAVRLLLFTLAVTPLMRITRWKRPIVIRRLLGLSVLAYALAHLTLYAAQETWDLAKVASEIVLRFYLLIGFVALIGLAALGATSTDAMIRRLGKRWRRLHQASYAIAVLALAHYFLQSKHDVSQAVLMSGLFLWLMGARLVLARRWPLDNALVLAGLALVSALLTAGLEAAWYGLATGASAWRILEANFSFVFTVSPAWYVLAAASAPVVVALGRALAARLAPALRPAGREQRGA